MRDSGDGGNGLESQSKLRLHESLEGTQGKIFVLF